MLYGTDVMEKCKKILWGTRQKLSPKCGGCINEDYVSYVNGGFVLSLEACAFSHKIQSKHF
jgi:hypothetical protein